MMARMRAIPFVLLVVACGKSPSRDERKEPSPTQSSEPAQAPKPALSQRYASDNKLIVLHYPMGFEPESEKNIVLLSGEASGVSATLGFVSIREPVTDQVDEFDRVIHGAVSKKLEAYVELSSGDCKFGGVRGIEHVGTFVSKGIPVIRHSCHFVRNGHGYAFSFTIPQPSQPKAVLELQRIQEATEFSE